MKDVTKKRGGRRPGAGRPRRTEPKRTIVFNFDESVYNRLTEYAKAHGKSRTAVLTEYIKSLDIDPD